jgi:hypothetical protein
MIKISVDLRGYDGKSGLQCPEMHVTDKSSLVEDVWSNEISPKDLPEDGSDPFVATTAL